MNDRRKHKRRHTIFYLKVYDETTGKVAGRLVDITIEGMMLVSEKQVDMSNIFDFRLALPEKINGVDELTLKAKSVRLSVCGSDFGGYISYIRLFR